MSNLKLILTNIAILVAGILIWKIWSAWGEMGIAEKFIIFMVLCITVAVPVVAYVMPAIGDKIGEFFYSAPEKVEEDPYAKAAATLSRGDYDEALKAYRSLSKENPRDRFPVVEISKILMHKKSNVDDAISTLQEALDRGGWRENDEAFFLFRLSDIYREEKEDKEKAREYLMTTIERFPDTRHSANATHKLHELDKA